MALVALLRYPASQFRVLPSAEHDAAFAAYVARLLGQADHPVPEGALQTAQLAARFSGRCALADRHAARGCILRRRRRHSRRPHVDAPDAMSHVTTSVDGSDELPTPLTRAREMAFSNLSPAS